MVAKVGNFYVRGAQNRKMRQDAVRQQLRAKALIENIQGVLTLSPAQVNEHHAAYKLKLDGWFRLLNKVLPDLKAVEISGNPDRPISYVSAKPDALTSEQWAAKFGAQAIEGEIVEDDDVPSG